MQRLFLNIWLRSITTVAVVISLNYNPHVHGLYVAVFEKISRVKYMLYRRNFSQHNSPRWRVGGH